MIKLKIVCSLLILLSLNGFSQNATDIVKKADAKMKGEKTSISQMTMQIIRPNWQRILKFKTWSMGTDYSLALILSPAKEKGQSFLKYKREMWSWNPTIKRVIKLPPSMLSSGWMSSDFTNDDLLNESSIVVDYTHTISGEEKIDGHDCYKIILTPKEDAPVVWGEIKMWISRDEFLQLRIEYYDEDEYLIKTELASDIKTLDGRVIPTHFELIPADDEGHKTILTLDMIEFNKPIQQSFFSQQNMKRVR